MRIEISAGIQACKNGEIRSVPFSSFSVKTPRPNTNMPGSSPVEAPGFLTSFGERTGRLSPHRLSAKAEIEDIRPVVVACNVQGHFFAVDRGKIDISDDRRLLIEDRLDEVAAVRPDDRAATAQNESFAIFCQVIEAQAPIR